MVISRDARLQILRILREESQEQTRSEETHTGLPPKGNRGAPRRGSGLGGGPEITPRDPGGINRW